ncbi:30S ribosomal protein S13 [bacterium (Candidatus Gribaldobacteria) CG_4_9_14_3_um_filter_36_15]|uniref:Small ribosomal subunit protein uS13 n=4 Tax=Candidatus Gribaldobacteria TaxID=2798536 RepID=A0A2H0UZ76_9BACT|nr:MAG: 30S ribosomal protein S13 [Parcubacteria group bacterium CG2_30_36_21]PIR91410.1 MAG: 30S ribosomal protein S13 [bacterium (Candidatus Gribaldobacteria) CG10_big_fil_rev_8_21_14_0_10_37_46]PIV14158.1 MAG: 30S ribosomal protein S13 [bacterium (Candidatus Gribaldobacteria) CG03_land_8_20_14_0_80_36_40]PJB09195.1 MAG: 30S ribosomal protein S13 [bacterium (Candidatus Gribaldobacteria) CG_4_9_14_3_um_filter_36_15]
MPRIAGINIPNDKQIDIALTYIYGIGQSLSRKILRETQINPSKKASDLTEAEILKIKKIIDGGHKIEGELRRELLKNIRRLEAIGCWRGVRHRRGLPVRGQKTRKNSRTIRGNLRKTVGSGRKAAPAPK